MLCVGSVGQSTYSQCPPPWNEVVPIDINGGNLETDIGGSCWATDEPTASVIIGGIQVRYVGTWSGT